MKQQKPKYHIIWQKYEDPLSQMKQGNSRITQDEDNSFDDTPLNPSSFIKSFPIMATPMGIFPMPEPDTSSFDFWIGHTNFNITGPIFNILERAIGVESLDLFTRYRFRIGIGKAFWSEDVRATTSLMIMKHLKNVKQKNNLST